MAEERGQATTASERLSDGEKFMEDLKNVSEEKKQHSIYFPAKNARKKSQVPVFFSTSLFWDFGANICANVMPRLTNVRGKVI